MTAQPPALLFFAHLIKGSLLKFNPRKVDMVEGNVEDPACTGLVPTSRKVIASSPMIFQKLIYGMTHRKDEINFPF